DSRGDQRHAPARPGVRGQPGAGARHRRRGRRQGARGGARDARRRPPRHAPASRLTYAVTPMKAKPTLSIVVSNTPQPSAPEPPPQQVEMPFAVVNGEPISQLPRDLYIPPQALEVFLEAFEGPLDLLLYLIRRQNLNILDIPLAEITRQYMQYIELMQGLQLELAGEYLVMAATLAEIKSRMLLPRPRLDARAECVPFQQLFRPAEGRMGVTVTFAAILELMREGLIEIVQAQAYAPLHVRAVGAGRMLRVVSDSTETAAPAVEGAPDSGPPARR